MPDRIPIKAAKDVATTHNLRQVILLGWDGELTHIVTYGKSTEDCAQAATGGNLLKEKWGWPECNDQPSRVKKLESQVCELTGAMKAQDEREAKAGELCGVSRELHGCDWPDAVAERVRELTALKEKAELSLEGEIAELRAAVEKLDALANFARHQEGCAWWTELNTCSCGMAKAWRELSDMRKGSL